jgi:hypothetical protein
MLFDFFFTHKNRQTHHVKNDQYYKKSKTDATARKNRLIFDHSAKSCIESDQRRPTHLFFSMKKIFNHAFSITELMLLGGITLGFCVNAFSRLPYNYSWMQCFDILNDSVQDRHFPVFATLAVICGILSTPAQRSALQQLLKQPALEKNKIFPMLIAGCALSYLLCHSHNYTLLDMAGCLVFSLAIYGLLAISSDHYLWLKVGAGIIAFQLVSYAFTIIKSQLFVISLPHDQAIIQAEKFIFNSPTSPYIFFAEFGRNRPDLLLFLEKIYFGFFQHILIVSAFLMGSGQKKLQASFGNTLALCYILGSFSYYLLPTLGPVYADPDAFSHLPQIVPFTSHIQKALYGSTLQASTGKLQTIQTYMFAAATPSLHMAHESIMVFFCRKNLPMLALSIFLWGCSALAVLCLGWHYLLDIPAGTLLAWCCIRICVQNNRKFQL